MSALDDAFARILDGQASHEEVMNFLERSIAWMDPEALAAGARALRARMIPVNAPDGAIDVCGTGGDGAHTLNISTAVAFVVAGAGVPVAKHGNRAMSSKSGAADVLEALRVKLTGDVPTLERALREANVAFLFAQNHHPAMRHVAAARKELGKRTIFNLLGPLANPAGVKRQLLGVFAPELILPMAEALRLLGAERAAVVHGAGGLDEYSFIDDGAYGENLDAFLDEHGEIEDNTDCEWLGILASTLNVALTPPGALAGGDAAFNAENLTELLGDRMRDHPYEHAVLLNASAALVIARKCENQQRAWEMAKHSIRSGAARRALERLIELTRAAP